MVFLTCDVIGLGGRGVIKTWTCHWLQVRKLQWLSWQNFTLIFENAGTAFLAAKNAFSQNFVSRMKKPTILLKYFSYDLH